MIINTGSRTDIPAFYSEWFINRIKEAYVMTRNPYYPSQVLKYSLDPELVDCLVFCTKNPKPMLKYLNELDKYNQFWFITITPYGKDIEPNVIDKYEIIEAVKQLSKHLGNNCVALRYDPIFINDKYNIEYHLKAFNKIVDELKDYISEVVVSFIDLYQKTKKNFPEVKEVSIDNQKLFIKEFKSICDNNQLELRACLESDELKEFGIKTNSCMDKEIIERAINQQLILKQNIKTRQGCNCLLGNDIGEYNTCGHLCKYCYANYNAKIVKENMKKHDKNSPLLIGNLKKDDKVREVKQVSWISKQTQLDL